MVDVSVVTTVFNETPIQIERMVKSVGEQTFKGLIELIVVVDNVDLKNIDYLLEPFLRDKVELTIIYNEENLGLAKSLNKGISLAKGLFIARLDSDDWMDATRIEKQYLALKKVVNGISFTESEEIDFSTNTRIQRKYRGDAINSVRKLLIPENKLIHSTVMFRKTSVNTVGNYRQLEPAEDYDLWLRFFDKNVHFVVLPEVLVFREVRMNSISNSNMYRQHKAADYVRTLHRQRIANNTGVDDYSKANYDAFLKEAGAETVRAKKYNEAYKSWQSIKLGDFGIGDLFAVLSSWPFEVAIIGSGIRRMRKKFIR